MGAIIVLLLLIAVIGSALGVIYAREQNRRLFVDYTQLIKEHDDLNVEFSRLELEQATWAETNRIEQVARGQLGLISPGPATTIVVRR
ncbi:MAG: cell division protein FtsL [Rudaea sp.]|nr:cell division protein FtsL [Rudaea sp.]